MQLLAKTRMLNKVIQEMAGHSVDYDQVIEVLRRLSEARVAVVDKEGELLACQGFEFFHTGENGRGARRLAEKQRIWLNSFEETEANLSPDYGRLDSPADSCCIFDEEGYHLVIPVIGNKIRLATLLLIRSDRPFSNDDLILGEFGATVVALEMLYNKSYRDEQVTRKRNAAQIALNSLSHSEREAVDRIFDEIEGDEGLMVATKLANNIGVTSSVIVNALGKLESAGVIETRSLGMKGTHIRILNDRLEEEMASG